MARDRERKASEEKRVRTRASLIYQARALIRKQVALQVREFTTSCLELSAALQRRRWVTNLVLVLTPIVFCFLLLGLSMLIESELGSKNFRCGCKCTACFDWVLIEEDGTSKYEYRYFESTPEKPCLRSSNCQSYDESSCGVQYSKDSQAPLCAIEEPPIYPAFIKVPYEATNGSLVQERTALYTGQNKAYATQLMHQLLPHDQSAAVQFLDLLGGGIQSGINIDPLGILSDPNACLPSGIKFEDRPGNEIGSSTEEGGFTDRQTRKLRQLADSKTGQAFGLLSEELLELVNNFTHTLSDLGIILGTPAASSRSLFIEPALLPVSEQEALYMLLNNCSALSPTQLKGLKKASCTTELMIGRPLECISIDPSWRPDAEDIDYELYCHGDRSPCYTQTRDNSIVKENSTEHISMIYNWKSTRNRHFNVDIRVNYANNFKTDRTPNLQRYNAPLNLATNAFLRQQLKDLDYSVRLYGLKGMPKPETRVTIDFSSLLGPLFFLWLLQLLLPVNVHSLMYEKQNHLRIMMKMQGLDDRVYYTVTYLWQMFIYGCFIAIFIISGSWIGLSIFTKTQLSFQIVFYALWGNVMTAWSFWIASVFKDCKSAVHTVIVWVIGSGLMGSFLLAPFVTQGPTWIAHAMQTVPSFGLYRGVWELAQYSFLASYNAGTGLTWGSLKDNHNGMIRVLITFTIEWFVFLLGAWYNDQVLDNGTGTRRHPLFFFGKSYDKGKNCKESVITFTKEAEPVLTIPETGCPKVDPSFDVSLKFTNPPLRQRSIASKKDSKSGSGKSSSSRSSTSASKVLGGTPIDDSVTGTGSYWGSAESMPASSVPGSPSLLHPDKTTNLHELLQMPMSPVNRSDIEKARLHPSILPTTLELLYFQIARTRTIEASGRLNSGAFCDDDAPDVAMERARVQRIWDSIRLGKDDLDDEAAIVLKNLRKVYPKRGQAYPKVAVDNLSLAISKHECFGLLGPNGAGKTTTIRMMEGFLEQSSGSVSIAGLDTQQDMSTIYSMMGACPQHDLLWNTLTGREHLLFYGRLKNLKGEALTSAVYSSLKSVNLLADAIGDKQVGSYSGGMKRRLSVAISLIGSPLVAYLDEPSTGLDPSSRRLLWDVIKKAKKRTAIVLTTHSMEEAEALCDRLGIFVGGKLQCIGNPKDLTARYGSYLQFSMTTAAGQEEMAAASIYTLCPTARPVYALGGTQKFELPTKDVDLEQVFTHMDELKNNSKISILDWGVSNATLEEVFIKITNDAGVRMTAFT